MDLERRHEDADKMNYLQPQKYTMSFRFIMLEKAHMGVRRKWQGVFSP